MARRQFAIAEPGRADYRSLSDMGTAYLGVATAFTGIMALSSAALMSIGLFRITILQRYEDRIRRLEEELAMRGAPTP
jgi:hypothetical protein